MRKSKRRKLTKHLYENLKTGVFMSVCILAYDKTTNKPDTIGILV